MKNFFRLLPLISLLPACTSPLTRDQKLSIYKTRCLDYGYQLGTPEFADCVMKQEHRVEQMSLQRRKVEAIEESNWLERERSRAQERERLEEHKRKKKRRKAEENPF